MDDGKFIEWLDEREREDLAAQITADFLLIEKDDGGPPSCCRDSQGNYAPCAEHDEDAERRQWRAQQAYERSHGAGL